MFREGENVPKSGVPESFKVLIKELQSLGLDVKVLDDYDNEIAIKEDLDEDESDVRMVKFDDYEVMDLDDEDKKKEQEEEDKSKDLFGNILSDFDFDMDSDDVSDDLALSLDDVIEPDILDTEEIDAFDDVDDLDSSIDDADLFGDDN